VSVHRVLLPDQVSPTSLFETLFMDRVLENPGLHIRTAHWPTDIPLEAPTTLVEPGRLVESGKKWYGWRERDQGIFFLTVGNGEAKAWVAASDVRALDREIARLRALLPECSLEDTCQVAIRFWTCAGSHTTHYRRRLDAYQWETTRDNYVGAHRPCWIMSCESSALIAVDNYCCGMGHGGRAKRPCYGH